MRQIVLILMSLVFMVSCLLLVFQDRIIPPLHKKSTGYLWRVMKNKPDFYLDFRQDKIWYRSKNLIYNLKSFDVQNKLIKGMAVYTFDEDFNLIQFVEANRAKFTDEGWTLNDGAVTVFGEDDKFPLTKKFKEKKLKIGEKPKDFLEIEREVEGLRLKELHGFIERSRFAGADTKSFEVQFHSRIALSFIPIVMAFLAIPFSVRTNREGGMAIDLGICALLTIVYWGFYTVSLSLGKNGAFPPVLAAWMPSVIFAIVAFASMYLKRR